MHLADKVAIVTGAGSGIGRAIALRFASEGAKVAVAEIEEESGKQTVHDILKEAGEALFVKTDVTDAEQVEQMVSETINYFGTIQILVNNAGVSYTEDILDIEPESWHRDIATNLTSFYLCCKAVLPIMIEIRNGSIVNISSVNALVAIGEFGYSAAKAGIINLTKNLAVRYGEYGIRCNVICPGTIESERGGAYWDEKVGDRKKLLKWYPLRRLGKPEEVAACALFLASDESSFVTGTILTVDGGLTAGMRFFGHDISSDQEI